MPLDFKTHAGNGYHFAFSYQIWKSADEVQKKDLDYLLVVIHVDFEEINIMDYPFVHTFMIEECAYGCKLKSGVYSIATGSQF